MHVRFVAQPFQDGEDLRDFVAAVAADTELTELSVVVAWAKRSGLSKIAPSLTEIKRRSVHGTRLIVGIDEGGATWQGLGLARQLFDEVRVFHDPSSRTFHPKMYVAWSNDAEGEGRAEVFVGSNNLTAGGVYFNYEAAFVVSLKLPEDVEVLDSVIEYIERLHADEDVCLVLDDETFVALRDNPRYKVRDEDTARKPKKPEDAPAENVDTDVDQGDEDNGPSLFGKSQSPKKAAPPVAGQPPVGGPPPQPTPVPAAGEPVQPPPAQPVPPAGVPGVARRWFKKMAASDAQHPPQPGSNVTGVLRLTQAQHGIDQTTYFRHTFFGRLNWQPIPNKPGFEGIAVPFEVEIDGVPQGSHQLRVDHAAHREAGQGNVTTVLHWDSLGQLMAQSNYSQYWVMLESRTDHSFKLTVTPTEPTIFSP